MVKGAQNVESIFRYPNRLDWRMKAVEGDDQTASKQLRRYQPGPQRGLESTLPLEPVTPERSPISTGMSLSDQSLGAALRSMVPWGHAWSLPPTPCSGQQDPRICCPCSPESASWVCPAEGTQGCDTQPRPQRSSRNSCLQEVLGRVGLGVFSGPHPGISQ